MLMKVCSGQHGCRCVSDGNRNRPCLLSGQAFPSCLCSSAVGWCPGIISVLYWVDLSTLLSPFPACLSFHVAAVTSLSKLIQKLSVTAARSSTGESYMLGGRFLDCQDQERACPQGGAKQLLWGCLCELAVWERLDLGQENGPKLLRASTHTWP